MADAFAIIWLIDTIVGWSAQIYKFLSDVAGAPAEITSLLSELHTPQETFSLVRDTASRIRQSSILANSAWWLPALRGVLEQCKTDFKLLLTIVVGSKQDNYIHSWERLYRDFRWVLKKDELQETVNRLKRYKSSLMLILLSSQYARPWSHTPSRMLMLQVLNHWSNT